MTNEFLGFMRPDGHAGARNTLLILPINRSLNRPPVTSSR